MANGRAADLAADADAIFLFHGRGIAVATAVELRAGEPGRTGGPRARTEPAASFSCQERLKSVILFRGLRCGWLRARRASYTGVPPGVLTPSGPAQGRFWAEARFSTTRQDPCCIALLGVLRSAVWERFVPTSADAPQRPV